MIDEKLAAVIIWEYLEETERRAFIEIVLNDGRIIVVAVRPKKEVLH